MLALTLVSASANAREQVTSASERTLAISAAGGQRGSIDRHDGGGIPEIAVKPEPAPFASEEILGALADAGEHWRIEPAHGPIHVWTPEAYDPKTAATVVFVHGYHTDADEAWTDYRLAQQFA